ncbi:MAG TPA: tyrosine-type recombinase/integrase [Verrucomicrobiae bacterium]|jgi:integrase|nr:tyrosine-type recombinase/integrase [Verrucomicrobiae bacterium]
MKARFTLFRRAGIYYSQDTVNGKQQSLRTKDESEALTLLHSKNEAHRQSGLNLQIARTYLTATDPEIAKRTWLIAMQEMTKTKTGSTLSRYERAMEDKAFLLIRDLAILETNGAHFLKVLEAGGVATNVFLRRLHNFALDMNWLPWPVLPKKRWPAVRFKEKRAITCAEHQAVINRERNPELRDLYALLWHTGGSQSDIAALDTDNIDWERRIISYGRRKTGSISHLCFGNEAEAILRRCPSTGPLFPKIGLWHEKHRAKEFKRRCVGLGIHGVTLHSYRYAWAERALKAGYPERFAQEALGHNSKAVHRAYARKAQVVVPTLEDYEKRFLPLRIRSRFGRKFRKN